MKNLFKGMILGMLCIMLVACGGKPSDMSDNGYEIGEKILDVTSQYLDGDLDNNEAKGKIEKLIYQIETATDYNKDDKVFQTGADIYQAMSKSSQKDVQALKQELKDLLNK